MKVFQESLIEQAILDAASVICATDSPLSPIFRGMINANEKILKPVDNIVYVPMMVAVNGAQTHSRAENTVSAR